MAQFEIVEVKTFVVGHRDPTETGGSRSIVAMSSSGTKIAGDSVQVYSAGTKPGTAVNDLSAQALAEGSRRDHWKHTHTDR